MPKNYVNFYFLIKYSPKNIWNIAAKRTTTAIKKKIAGTINKSKIPNGIVTTPQIVANKHNRNGVIMTVSPSEPYVINSHFAIINKTQMIGKKLLLP